MRETSWPVEKLLDLSRSTVLYGVILLVDVNYMANARTKLIVKKRQKLDLVRNHMLVLKVMLSCSLVGGF
jgi:hypothetical protein